MLDSPRACACACACARRVVAVALVAAAGAWLCAASGPGVSSRSFGVHNPLDAPRVSVSVDGLRLDGVGWWPVGINAPQLLSTPGMRAGCGANVNLDAFFAVVPAHSLVRFNLFQSLVIDQKRGTLNFDRADAIFAAAWRHQRLILPVLAPQDGACDGGLMKDRRWYVDGWQQRQAGAVMSFAQWVSTVVGRFAGSPAIAGWELVGEPEPTVCADASCGIRSCPADAVVVLRKFFDDAGALLRSADPRRLIFAGLLGGDQCGTAGDGYVRVGESPFIDVLTYHDYSGSAALVAGGGEAGVGAAAMLDGRLRQARALGKPLVVEELGRAGGSCGSGLRRRDEVAAALEADRAAGVAGVLLWAFVPDPRVGLCTFDIGPDDPLMGEIGAQTQYPRR
ncbi:Endo-beta-mannanase [Mycobacteroides abscessus subsp. abscessus]|nr:Endo-beta-mannanase [Mycobacteroides abscessus subsp. abscessus]